MSTRTKSADRHRVTFPRRARLFAALGTEPRATLSSSSLVSSPWHALCCPQPSFFVNRHMHITKSIHLSISPHTNNIFFHIFIFTKLLLFLTRRFITDKGSRQARTHQVSTSAFPLHSVWHENITGILTFSVKIGALWASIPFSSCWKAQKKILLFKN